MKKQGLDADVLIIGGGPAGSTLGCLLALGEHKAIVIERMAHPREHVGELLTPSVNAVLHRIGLLHRMDEAGFMRRNGVGWTTPGAQLLNIPVADYPPPRALRRYGFSVERDVFDALLLRRASELGVEILEHTTARRILFQKDRAVGVEVLRPDGKVSRLTGHFIVDASGRRSLLGTQLGLLHRDSFLRQCAFYAWFRDVEPFFDSGEDYAYFHRLGHQPSWGWQIPLRDNVTSIGVVGPCENLRAANEKQDVYFASSIEHNHIFERAMANAQRIKPWRSVGNYNYRMQRLYGRGWLLVGDASGFIDPIFSSGVDIAMHSAVFAYEAMLPLLLLGRWNEADEEFATSRYQQRLRRGTAVWAHAVDLFYGSPRRLRQLANQPLALKSICRFLQGNPYELQNELIIQQLFDSIAPQKWAMNPGPIESPREETI